jgi:hypothetical protein
MARSFRTTLIALLASLALAGTAQAAGGNYVIEGGSPEAQETVRAALSASSFDFSRVPAEIKIKISRCGCAGARPGVIVLDEAVDRSRARVRPRRGSFGRRRPLSCEAFQPARAVSVVEELLDNGRIHRS